MMDSDWSYASPSQGTPEATGSRRGKRVVSPRAFRESTALPNTLILYVGPPVLWENVVLSHQIFF